MSQALYVYVLVHMSIHLYRRIPRWLDSWSKTHKDTQRKASMFLTINVGQTHLHLIGLGEVGGPVFNQI